jgi:sugar lactone lactonase YvrE
MANNVNADGSPGVVDGTRGILYRVDPDRTVTEWKREIGIANTLAWNPERTRFYTADTLANSVFVYEYEQATGEIRNEKPFFCDFPRGEPDGSAVDSEGYLWNCRYGGSCIVRVAPDGNVDKVIEIPVENVTTCTFGGPDLKTLYVTTASAGAGTGNRFAGGLFAVETTVKGQSENRFTLK